MAINTGGYQLSALPQTNVDMRGIGAPRLSGLGKGLREGMEGLKERKELSRLDVVGDAVASALDGDKKKMDALTGRSRLQAMDMYTERKERKMKLDELEKEKIMREAIKDIDIGLTNEELVEKYGEDITGQATLESDEQFRLREIENEKWSMEQEEAEAAKLERLKKAEAELLKAKTALETAKSAAERTRSYAAYMDAQAALIREKTGKPEYGTQGFEVVETAAGQIVIDKATQTPVSKANLIADPTGGVELDKRLQPVTGWADTFVDTVSGDIVVKGADGKPWKIGTFKSDSTPDLFGGSSATPEVTPAEPTAPDGADPKIPLPDDEENIIEFNFEDLT